MADDLLPSSMEITQSPSRVKTAKPGGEGASRPTKRRRLTASDQAALRSRRAEPNDSLEVDIMVLDYLAYQAIAACLASRGQPSAASVSVDLACNLTMTDTFLQIFRSQHPNSTFDAELRFRLLLLQLATLVTQRMTRNPSTPSRRTLEELRRSNRNRARDWIRSADRLPSIACTNAVYDEHHLFPTNEELERNRAHVLHSLAIPAEDEQYEDAFYGTTECIALLDLLPLFMRVSAASLAIINGEMKQGWMDLAAELMVQACLEQYLVVGSNGTDAIDEAFAWGYQPPKTSTLGTEDGFDEREQTEDEVNDMFCQDDYYEEVEGWAATKQAHLSLLFPPPPPPAPTDEAASSSPIDGFSQLSPPQHLSPERPHQSRLTNHLENLALSRPIQGFEAKLLDYLSGLAQSVAKPVLIQLESGQLDGMTSDETATFLRECGLSVARFFEPPAGFKEPAGKQG